VVDFCTDHQIHTSGQKTYWYVFDCPIVCVNMSRAVTDSDLLLPNLCNKFLLLFVAGANDEKESCAEFGQSSNDTN